MIMKNLSVTSKIRMSPSRTRLFACLKFPLFLVLLTLLLSKPTTAKKVVNYIPNELSRSEVLTYFRSVLRTKISSYDKVNEEIYFGEMFPDDLYHNIETLMSHQLFSKYLIRTRSITDRNDYKGNPLTRSHPGDKCSPSSIFNQTVPEILANLEKDKWAVYRYLENWHIDNLDAPEYKICNRFLGLTCQHGKVNNSEDGSTSCQCAGDEKDVGFFSDERKMKGKSKYPDGCYIRPWRPCSHLSLDYAFRNLNFESHTSLWNQKRLLTQMVFPVPRTHRCKQGTYCLDLIPGMKHPICWCNQESTDEACLAAFQNQSFTVLPVGAKLASIRRNFLKLFIPVNDTRHKCDPRLNNIVEQIENDTGANPTETGVIDVMRVLVGEKNKTWICDFRRSHYCNPNTSSCFRRWTCEPGKIHVGNGVCAVKNGFPCKSNEECVKKAQCKQAGATLTSTCVCKTGYGDKCKGKGSFFGGLFQPITSGFKGDEFANFDTEIHSVLKSWEEKMGLNEGEACDPSVDSFSIEIVKYFGNLQEYSKEVGDRLLQDVVNMVNSASTPRLCKYAKFLRCDSSDRKCVPMLGAIQKMGSKSVENINVEVMPGKKCGPLPKVFENLVEISCSIGHVCKTEGDDGHMICQPDCDSTSAPKENCNRPKRQNAETDVGKNTTKRDSPDNEPLQRASKAQGLVEHQQSCDFSDDGSSTSSDSNTTCNAEYFLHCVNHFCECHPPTKRAKFKDKCMLPIGAFCDTKEIHLPAYMNKAMLECEYGSCVKDTMGKICRPEKDTMLILIPFKSAKA